MFVLSLLYVFKGQNVTGNLFVLLRSEKKSLPNMPIPILAFEQLPFGEATETEWRDVYGLWGSIQN